MGEKFIKIFDVDNNCCGCTACMTVCKQKAISMKTDDKGFLYPEIDRSKCVNCGLCVKTCAFQKGYITPDNFDVPLVYAVKHKDYNERKTSRSGGMFAALVDWILSKNGVVYGAGYGEDFYVLHKRAETKSDSFEFKGSKYVQSDINNVFSQVIDDLINDKYVLFSGTPCQTAGLYSCLKNVNTDRLYVCDIVCHGTPSPYIWRDYLKYSKDKYKSNIESVDFRNKKYGWNTHIESLCFKNGKKVSSEIYSSLFWKCIMLRPSCGNCKYTNTRRPSDITLADFWGIDKAVPGFNDNKGVSLVFINTLKGQSVFNDINDNLDYRLSKLEDCMQHNMKEPSKFSDKTDEFWNDYKSKGFEFVVNKYVDMSLKGKIKFRIKLLYKLIKRNIN